ncbi:MAG: anthranilate synthase component I family protein, partial [Geminicoccaceae bacterium]
MAPRPELADFTRRYQAGRPQVVWTSLVADLETPVSAMLKLAEGRPYSFLLESVEGGAVRGRYSAIGLKPDLIWRCFGRRSEINRTARHDLDAFAPSSDDALADLRALIRASRIAMPDGLPPISAGLFGYLGYDMVRLMERLPDARPDTLGIPDAVFMRPTVVAVFDNIADQVTVVTPVWPSADLTARAAYDLARERLADLVADFDRPLPHRPLDRDTSAAPEPVSNVTRERYHAMVEQAREYILAGDIFQVVPSQRFTLPFHLPPFALYRALRRLNPSPFLFFLDFDGFALVGSSPEILVRLRDGVVTVRPLAGTRRRGASREEDAALAADLLGDPKELAEHLM